MHHPAHRSPTPARPRPRASALLAAALLALVAAACADQTLLQPDDALFTAAQRGPATGFPLVLLGQGNGPNTATTLDEAVEKVADGGTIRVFPGTWSTGQAVITRPVTVEGAGGARPVLVVEPLPEGTFPAGIQVVDVAGTVTFRNLVIDNTGAPGTFGAFARGTQRLNLEDVDFQVEDGVTGLRFIGTGAGETLAVNGGSFVGGFTAIWGQAARLMVDGTAFSGQGGFGVYGGLAADVAVRGASFDGCGRSCIYVFGLTEPGPVVVSWGSLLVDDVDATDCGALACVYAVNGVEATVTGSRLSNASPNGTVHPTQHHVVFFWLSRGEIADNVIDGCGLGQCITVSGSSDADIVGNQITAYGDQRTRIGIVVSDGFLGSHRASTARVLGNRVIGVGGNPANVGGHAIGCEEWGQGCGPVVVEGGSQVQLSSNELANGNMGIYVRTGASVTGRDNRVSQVGRGIAIYNDGSHADLRFNDITGATILDIDHSAATPGSDLSCNWWGSAAGPSAVASPQAPGIYTPWATQPVAGTGATSCSGS
jgi:hypothetical protein